jgi:alkylation response protein AidB-like acyl-CoA dehydrogenase
MTYNFSETQQPIRERVRAFGEKEIGTVGLEYDRREEQFPHEMYAKLGKAGFVGAAMPKEYGGGGLSNLDYITMIEELTYCDPAIGLMCAIPQLATYPIYNFGTEEQKKKYVPKCASGEHIISFVLTERTAGSDASNQKTTAVLEGDNYIVNGEKIFIMHGDVCHIAVLFCKIADENETRSRISSFIVDTDTPGWTRRTLKHKMGMRAATTGMITLKDVKVPTGNLLGEKGRGFKIAMNTLDGARIGVAAQALGIAQRALDESIKFAKERIAFGAPISKLQAIQWMIADMSTKLEASRLMTYKAAQMQDRGENITVPAAQCKMFVSESARFCVDRAMQIHSGYGYIGEFSIIEKLYRDQRVTEIYEGTNEIQRLVVANTLLR